jgi:ferritin-like metal-binding protein YciE
MEKGVPVPMNQIDVIQTYLADAIAAESSFEAQLRDFADDGDDDEVKAVFAEHAAETRIHRQRLTERLNELGSSASAGKNLLAQLFSLGPRTARIGHIQEERTVQNIIIAFTVETSEQAMYHALISVAEAAGDLRTAALAREIQAEETRTAEKLWHFLPTRSKIAYNMLTVQEVDPAVETKVADDRIIS